MWSLQIGPGTWEQSTVKAGFSAQAFSSLDETGLEWFGKEHELSKSKENKL